MKLIDKDAVLAIIEKFIYGANIEADIASTGECFDEKVADAKYQLCKCIKGKIDTLEVKEVDLEKYYHDFLQKEWFGKSHVRTISEMMAFTAKHFFELGLRSIITEEDCKLIWNIGDEIPNMPEEEFFKELLRRYKVQKGEKV